MITRTHQRDLHTTATAIYSDCQQYRYRLLIEWDTSLPRSAVVGLNPSTATEKTNDPTIRRIERWARRNGYGCLAMYNAYAYRSTDPAGLWKVSDPVGSDNDMFLRDELCRLGNDPVIVAWGVNIDPDREVEILTIASRSGADLRCWEITQDGFPGHPLYLSNAKMDSPISFGLSVPVDIS